MMPIQKNVSKSAGQSSCVWKIQISLNITAWYIKADHRTKSQSEAPELVVRQLELGVDLENVRVVNPEVSENADRG